MSSTQPPKLYPSETTHEIHGAPILTFFAPGSDAAQPLVVFLPGACFLARIAYGGHDGHRPEDFLAHWCTSAGFNFLAVSYPLEMSPPVLKRTHPDFMVADWGRCAAEAVRLVVRERGLGVGDGDADANGGGGSDTTNATGAKDATGTTSTTKIVLLLWSMAGKVLQPFTRGIRSAGLDIELVVALAATPALRGIKEKVPGLTPSRYGYAFPSGYKEYFLLQIREQNFINGGREIIHEDVLLREYSGGFPVGLGGLGLRWTGPGGQHQFVDDVGGGSGGASGDGGDDIAPQTWPFIGSVSPDSPLDWRHAITDRATWGLFTTHQLQGAFGRILQEHQGATTARTLAWAIQQSEKAKEVIAVIHDTASKLSHVVQGNHFFFVGEKGARETVHAVLQLLYDIERFKTRVSTTLSAST